MVIIKDLGLATLDGKLSRARPYYIVECPTCKKQFNMRKDVYGKSDQCRTCNKRASNKTKADIVLATKTKTCSMCKQKLPLSAFGTRKASLTGLRNACKACEKIADAACNKAYRSRPENKQKKHVYDKKYQQQNREHHSKLTARWNKNNPEKRTAIVKNDRHKRRELTKASNLPAIDLLQWEENQVKICSYCGNHCDTSYTIDHIDPLSKGGTHTLDNLTIACSSCNSSKNNKPLVLWLASRQFYNINS